MDLKEIENLITQGESSRLEFKSSDAQRDKINFAICAFANDLANIGRPGYILIGFDDQARPTRFGITDECLRNLAAIRSDGNILPPPTMNVEKLRIFDSDIAVVEVFPSYYPPVRYKGQVYISIGPTRRVATAEEERRLIERQRAGTLPFDHQPVFGATAIDMDIDLIKNVYITNAIAPEVLDMNSRSVEEQLLSLRFLSKDRITPTNAGLLIAGKEPREWMPGAYLQFVRFEGSDATTAIKDSKEISGNLVAQLRQIKELINLQIQTAQISDGITHVDKPDYPVAAISELLFNAFLHRNYEGTNTPIRYNHYCDHLEIISPGGLYGQVTPENIGKGVTDYRNPLIAEGMKVLGYVQRFGIGIQVAKKALKDNGNPELEFEIEPTHVVVTIRSL